MSQCPERAADDRAKGTMMKRRELKGPRMMTGTMAAVALALGLLIAVASTARADFPTLPVRRCGPDAVPAGAGGLGQVRGSGRRGPPTSPADRGLGWERPHG